MSVLNHLSLGNIQKILDRILRIFTIFWVKRICALFADGAEEIELITPVDVLKRVGAAVTLVSAQATTQVTGAHGVKISADRVSHGIAVDDFDAIILPGGPSSFSLKDDQNVIETVKKFNTKKKVICAICAAPLILSAAGILDDKKFCAHPCTHDVLPSVDKTSRVVIDGDLITAVGPGAAMEFSLAIVSKLFGKTKADDVRRDLLL